MIPPGQSSHPTSSALRADPQLAHLALEASQSALWDSDLVNNLVFLDERWALMLGQPPGETRISQLALGHFVHPEDRYRVVREQLAVTTGRATDYRIEHRVRHQSGRWIWILSRGQVVARDATGRALRMIGINTDITPQKTVSEQILRQKKFLEALHQTTLDLLSRREINDLLAAIATRAAALLDSYIAELALVEGDFFVTRAHSRDVAHVGTRVRHGEAPLFRQAYETGRPAVVEDYSALPVRRNTPLAATMKAVAVLPIMHGRVCLGVLALIRQEPDHPFTPDDIENGTLLAQQTALVLHNANIYRDAVLVAEERTNALRQFRIAMDQSTDAILLIDPATGRFVDCNEAACTRLGYTRAELLQLDVPAIEAILPDHFQWQHHVEHVRAAGQMTLEGRHRRKDGTTFPVEVSVRYVAQSPQDCMVAIARDITERKQAEAAQRENEERFRAVFDHSPISMGLLSSPEGRFVEVNQAGLDTFGLTREEVLGFTTEEIRLWADNRDRDRYLQILRDTGFVRGFEALLRTKTGEPRIVLFNARLITVGGKRYSLSSLLDITDRKRAEAKFHSLFAFAPDAILIASAQGVITDVNQRALTLFGFTREELIGQTAALLIPPSHRAALLARLQAYLAHPVPRAMGESPPELVAWDKSGRVFPIDISLSPLEDGDDTCVVAAIRDMTRQQAAEEARQRTEVQLRQAQKIESIGTLAGGIAHDFNNILTGMLGFIELARLELPPDHAAREWLDRLHASSNRAKNLVRQILTFSRKETGERTVLALQPVAEEAIRLLRATLPAMIELRTVFDPATPPVLADSTQIHQCLMNLCTNAWHALPDHGGWIRIELAPCQVAEPLAHPQPPLAPGTYARLSISDNGCGMDAATLERIFDPFFTTKKIGQGTGLGLAVVHGIMHAHRGSLAVRSTPGQGTAFELYFPAAPLPDPGA